MANEMRTYLTVVSNNPKVSIRLKEIFKQKTGNYETTSLDIINNIEGTNYCFSDEKDGWNRDVDYPNNKIWEKYIGPKWLYVEYDHGDNPGLCNIVIRSAWWLPKNLLSFLRDDLQKIDSNCYLKGTFEDESYNPCGSFVYGIDKYEDIEDIEEVYDWDESKLDDFYLEKFHDKLIELETLLVSNYIEFIDSFKKI